MATVADITEIDPAALQGRLASADPPAVLDVREDWERAAARLPGTIDIPMAEVPQRLAELPRDRDIVVMCQAAYAASGWRSSWCTTASAGSPT